MDGKDSHLDELGFLVHHSAATPAKAPTFSRGDFVTMPGGLSGVVVRPWDGTDIRVLWDKDPVGTVEAIGADRLGDLRSEFRFCPHEWDRFLREWKPGVELAQRRATKLLKDFGL
jgi:hypothetical protein